MAAFVAWPYCLNVVRFKQTFLLIFLSFLVNLCLSLEQDFTITVFAGKEECFYQNVLAGQVIDIEFQVIDGSGNFDIHFGMYNPQGKAIIVDFKKTDGAHRHAAKENGDYKICFDNTFSQISPKVVFFELIIDTDEEDEDEDDLTTQVADKEDRVTPEEIYEMAVEDIEAKVNSVRSKLQIVKHLQEQLRAFEARDRNLQERNYSTVNSWSAFQLIVMLVVSLIQVLMLRSLFDDKSGVRKLWKKMKGITDKKYATYN